MTEKSKPPKEVKFVCPSCKERQGKRYEPDIFTMKEARIYYQFRRNYPHGRKSKGSNTIIHRECGCESVTKFIVGGKWSP